MRTISLPFVNASGVCQAHCCACALFLSHLSMRVVCVKHIAVHAHYFSPICQCEWSVSSTLLCMRTISLPFVNASGVCQAHCCACALFLSHLSMRVVCVKHITVHAHYFSPICQCEWCVSSTLLCITACALFLSHLSMRVECVKHITVHHCMRTISLPFVNASGVCQAHYCASLHAHYFFPICQCEWSVSSTLLCMRTISLNHLSMRVECVKHITVHAHYFFKPFVNASGVCQAHYCACALFL